MKASFGFALALVVLVGCGGSTANGQSKAVVNKAPAQQQQFCQVLEHGFAEKRRLQEQAIPNEPNPLKKERLEEQLDHIEQDTFDSLYKIISPGGQFDSWHGRIGWSKPQPNGLINVTLSQICERAGYSQLLTGDSLVEPKGETGVLLNSPLGKTLVEIDPGTPVTASGRFVWARNFDAHAYDEHHAAIRVCGKFHFYETLNICHIPDLSLNTGTLNLLVQFTAIMRGR